MSKCRTMMSNFSSSRTRKKAARRSTRRWGSSSSRSASACSSPGCRWAWLGCGSSTGWRAAGSGWWTIGRCTSRRPAVDYALKPPPADVERGAGDGGRVWDREKGDGARDGLCHFVPPLGARASSTATRPPSLSPSGGLTTSRSWPLRPETISRDGPRSRPS